MDIKAVNTIKALGLDMINKANSGHPGVVLSACPIIYTLYKNHLNFNPQDPNYINRDRFVMSCGHASALLYSALHMFGFDITLDDLKKFRQINSKTKGHPELNIPGVDFTTGLLGMGLASSVGMAISEKYLNSLYNIIDHKIYCMCSDGDLQEGISYEAMSLAGTLNLNNLIILYDSNKINLDGDVNKTFNDNMKKRCESVNFNYIFVKDGSNIKLIDEAISKAKASDKPTLIEFSTILGKDSLLENTNKIHGKPLDKVDLLNIKTKFNLRNIEFLVGNDVYEYLKKEVNDRIYSKYNKFMDEYIVLREKSNNKVKKELDILNNKLFEYNIKEINSNESLRDINSKVLNEIVKSYNLFIGGSADLASSTKTYLNNMGDFSKTNYSGKNIWFGTREQLAAAVINGISTYNIKCFASTFLTFSDYFKSAIRISAISNLKVLYIFTHDSINIGEDGVTHQSIEQLSMLRNIPNITVYRPSSDKEIVGCYKHILNNNKPSVLVLSKYGTNLKTNIDGVKYGAYIIKKETKSLKAIIISSGTDLDTVYNLYKDNDNLRIISMVSIELFTNQDDKYKDNIINSNSTLIYVEASNCNKLSKYYNNINYVNIDKFGTTGNKEDVLKYMEFDSLSIKNKIDNIIK